MCLISCRVLPSSGQRERIKHQPSCTVYLSSFYTLSFYITHQMKGLHVTKNFPCVLHSSRKIFPESPSVSGCGSTPSWSSLRDTCSQSGMRSEPLAKLHLNCPATYLLLFKIYWMTGLQRSSGFTLSDRLWVNQLSGASNFLDSDQVLLSNFKLNALGLS